MRRFLDGIYNSAAVLAALSMIGILLMVLASIISRYISLPLLRGPDAYAGYFMAAAGFWALSHTLTRKEHIRVMLVLQMLGTRSRRVVELLCALFGTWISGALAWFSIRFVMETYNYQEVSSALDATPLWIPQMSMALGAVILFIAFIDLS